MPTKPGTGWRLSDEQLERLAAALEEGPAVYGWVEDQRWTLARVAELIFRLFRTPDARHYAAA